MTKFVEEKEDKNREAVFGALSSFLRAENFNSKREFINKMGGLQFLASSILNEKYTLRLQKKILILMYDLVLNDEMIFEEQPTLVRKTLGEQMGVMERLIEILQKSSQEISDNKQWDLREYTLRVLFRIFQICKDKLESNAEFLTAHIANLSNQMESCQEDDKDLF